MSEAEEGSAAALLAALNYCKDLQLKLTTTISTLEDHNDYLTDKCLQSAEQIHELEAKNTKQGEAMLNLSVENSSLRSKVNALQQFQESFEEIRKEVTSLRRTNLQLESNQRTLHSAVAEAKYHSMVRLSDKLFVSLEEERNKRLKTRAFLIWLGLLINKNASVGLAKHEAEKWRKKYEEVVGASVVETHTARREFLAKCDELDVEKGHVHKLSNRVRQLAQVIAELQEQHNAELEKAVTGLSSANIKFLASPDHLSSLKKNSSPDSMPKNRNGDLPSKMRSSLSPARTPESPTGVSQFTKSSPSTAAPWTPRSQSVPLEQVEVAIHDCREIFRQMAKKQGAQVATDDRRVRGLTPTSITQSLDPTHAVEIMITIVLNVFAKRKVTFPLTKISPTCYEWRGKKWHFAVHSQVLKARVGAGYEEFLSILSKEFALEFASKLKSPASREE